MEQESEKPKRHGAQWTEAIPLVMRKIQEVMDEEKVAPGDEVLMQCEYDNNGGVCLYDMRQSTPCKSLAEELATTVVHEFLKPDKNGSYVLGTWTMLLYVYRRLPMYSECEPVIGRE